MSFLLEKLSPVLFWDVARESLNWEQHKVWLLERILERGSWEDWLLVSGELSAKQLRSMEPTLKLEPRERNFLNNWIALSDVH